MTQAVLPSFARRSRIVLAVAVLLAVLVTVIEVPRAGPAIVPASGVIA